jgi:precorrin-6B methylase 2
LPSHLRRLTAAVTVALCLGAAAAAQQTALTDDQIKSADVEVPQLVQLLELKPGMTVADVGAGFGAWTMRFARALGPTSRIYATDIGTAQLAALRAVVKREGLDNVTVLEAGASSTNLPAACCDAILIRDAYHHLTQPEAVVASLAASLKPGGRLAVIDFPPRDKSEVPAGVPANRGGHGIPAEVVQAEVGKTLTYVRTVSPWSPSSQPASLYLVLFTKP